MNSYLSPSLLLIKAVLTREMCPSLQRREEKVWPVTQGLHVGVLAPFQLLSPRLLVRKLMLPGEKAREHGCGSICVNPASSSFGISYDLLCSLEPTGETGFLSTVILSVGITVSAGTSRMAYFPW